MIFPFIRTNLQQTAGAVTQSQGFEEGKLGSSQANFFLGKRSQLAQKFVTKPWDLITNLLYVCKQEASRNRLVNYFKGNVTLVHSMDTFENDITYYLHLQDKFAIDWCGGHSAAWF